MHRMMVRSVCSDQSRSQVGRTSMELLTADETTSDSGASTTSSPPPAPQDVDMSLLQDVAGRKKRKPTYYARKDEAEALKAEMEELQRRLDELMTAKEEAENEVLVQSMATNAALHLSVGQNVTTMAGVQGMLAAHQASGAPFPLESFIHLTTNLEQRRRTLLSLRDQKLRDGLEYMIERTRPLDLSKTQCKKEGSYTPEGFYTFHQFDATVFPGVQSVRHTYDVLRDFFRYQEISISEILGLISIRESDNCEDEPVLQCRMVTTLSNGLDVENNGAMFFSYFGHSDVLDSPYGIFIQETIDRDDMFPYQTDIRARLRLTAIVLLTQTPGVESSPSGSISVTMTRATFGCFHLPNDLVGNIDVEGPAQAFAAHVGGVMIQVLRERLGCGQP